MTVPRPYRARAFTLTEIIVVLTVIVIMLAVSVPAFRATIAGTEASNAETQLRLALATGRDAALHSDRQADSALVFFFEPGGRASAVACEYVGTITDNSGTPINGVQPKRDVFIPIPTFAPMQFPSGWMVRGFVPRGIMQDERDWYENLSNRLLDHMQRNWVFPETGFYDALARDDGADRQSFMIRFSGLTGAIITGDSREALVLAPRPTASGRNVSPFSDYRFDRGADLALVARRALQNDAFRVMQSSGGQDPLSRLFGDASGDTVLCRAVEQVALYKESELADALKIRLDRQTGSIYADGDQPEYVAGIDSVKLREMRRWIEGDSQLDGNDSAWLDDEDLPLARLYTFQRYTAELQPVPLVDLTLVRGGGS